MKLKLIVRPGMTKYLLDKNDTSTKPYSSIEFDLDFNQNINLEILFNQIGIPLEDCGLVIYNEKRLSYEDIIDKDGTIKIYPPIIGG